MMTGDAEERTVEGVVLVTRDLTLAVSGINYVRSRLPLYLLVILGTLILVLYAVYYGTLFSQYL